MYSSGKKSRPMDRSSSKKLIAAAHEENRQRLLTNQVNSRQKMDAQLISPRVSKLKRQMLNGGASAKLKLQFHSPTNETSTQHRISSSASEAMISYRRF